MKKMRRNISVLLIMMMLFTTMGFSVFAVGEDPGNEPAETTDTLDQSDQDIPEEVAEEAEEETEPAEPSEVVEDEVVEQTEEQEEQAEPVDVEPEVEQGIVVQEEAKAEAVKEQEDSPVLLKSTAPATAASITITNVKIVSYAGGKANIDVTWDYTGDLSGFTVRSGSGYKPKSVSGNTASFALEPGKSYKFKVTATKPNGKKLSSEYSAPLATRTAKVYKLRAHPSYNAVILDWSKSSIVDHFVVYKNGKKIATIKKGTHISKYNNKRVLYVVKGLEEFKSYKFKVVAYYDKETKGESDSLKSQPVRPITYNLKIKENVPYGTLNRKNNKGPKSVSLKAVEIVKAVGFNGGKYVFEKDGAIFNIVKMRISSVTCTYSTKVTYDKISAESYVNRKGLKSPTGQLIWVSTYTQELYIFTGPKNTKGKWTLKEHWAVSTGKASSPTPGGNTFIKEVWKKISDRHNLPWWTCFSSYNAFHGAFDSWVKKLGNPASGGCIRNTKEHAKWIYDNIKYKTTVLIR